MPGSGTNMEIVQLVIGLILLLAVFIATFRIIKSLFISSGFKKED